MRPDRVAMLSASPPVPGSPSPRRHRRGEKAYTTLFIALLLVPLLAFTGLAVDLGAWYARAAEIQRAADAAALAGVPLLSTSEAAAIAEARRVARLNGFDDADPGISVDVERVPGAQRLEVTITDEDVTQYFTTMFRPSGVEVGRRATAEQVLPVPLGSPRNYLGTAALFPSAIRENFWLGMSGTCASKEQGERITAISDANWTNVNNPPDAPPNATDSRFVVNGFGGCSPGTPSYVIPNTEYSADGYFYAVSVPPALANTDLDIQVYDAPYCQGGSLASGAVGAGDQSGAFATIFTVRDNDSLQPTTATPLASPTVLDAGSYTTGAGAPCGSAYTGGTTEAGRNCSGGWGACWHTLHTLDNPDAGIYFIQVQPRVPGSLTTAVQSGTNQFAFRVRRSGSSFTPCSADPASAAPAFSSSCPNVYGLTHLGVFASLGGSTPSFFLADIGAEHNNKVMEVSLWDSGEGATAIEILDPNGNAHPFRWTVMCQNGTEPPCSGETAPAGGYGPSPPPLPLSLNVGGGTPCRSDPGGSAQGLPQPGLHRLSCSRYNDRLLRLEVQLPTNITTAYGGRTWWRIRYTVGSTPTDRTTWSVIVRGDPVRLVPND